MFKLTSDELLLRHPFRAIVAGPSASGKTYFTVNLVKNRNALINAPPEQVVCVYRHWQPLYHTMEDHGVEFVQEIPDALPQNSLLIIDDMMLEANERLPSIFTKESHHQNTSVVYLAQSIFGNKTQRLLSTNASYMVLMKTVRDKLSISTLARQIFPARGAYFLDAYKKATKQPYSYLFVDLHPESRDKLRVRSHIFPEESPVHLYV